MTDSYGKFETFRFLALAMTVPIVLMTLLRPGSLVITLTITTLLFVFMSGRMIPGMAMLTSAANPALRGTFMTLNSCVQSASMGLAALVGGHIIGRDAQGLVQNYWVAGLLGATVSLVTIFVARRLDMHQAAAQVSIA
jgi:predicted MFS family arabinose efflux permease